jgi:hypothetical protein
MAAPAKQAIEKVDLLEKVVKLEQLRLQFGPPVLESAQEAVSYDMSSIASADYQDRIAFTTPFTEETKALEEMVRLWPSCVLPLRLCSRLTHPLPCLLCCVL